MFGARAETLYISQNGGQEHLLERIVLFLVRTARGAIMVVYMGNGFCAKWTYRFFFLSCMGILKRTLRKVLKTFALRKLAKQLIS
jgi:hypothetical protein